MYMVWMVLDQAALLDNIQQAWEGVGIRGATIIESTGFYRRKQGKKYIPTRYVLPVLSSTSLKNNYSIFCIVKDEAMVQAALRAAEEVTGDLNQPNRGVFAAWPLSFVKGLPESYDEEERA